MDARIGTTVDQRFRVEELIGKGAMADVYRALDLTTQVHVAVKFLKRQLAGDNEAQARFRREGEVQSRLRHKNVAALLATGFTRREEPYLAVELLRGKTLRGVIKQEGKIAPVRAASYAYQALQGLAAVHAAGVIHRDLKPANIMLEPSAGPVDRVVLIDFGFATFEGGTKLTLQGAVVGSLTYIAPERLRGESPDPRSDVYAIGVILFELLAGRPPFKGVDDFELIEQHLNVEPPYLLDLVPELPDELDAVIARALAKEPTERYASALAMAADLEVAAQKL
jgi:serine/threonine-protein kinase|nr:serine/threonine-protein kinase [Kofleriaceae bacterium]